MQSFFDDIFEHKDPQIKSKLRSKVPLKSKTPDAVDYLLGCKKVPMKKIHSFYKRSQNQSVPDAH
jgi:hypothetical protein